jgi:hypothetical protein
MLIIKIMGFFQNKVIFFLYKMHEIHYLQKECNRNLYKKKIITND